MARKGIQRSAPLKSSQKRLVTKVGPEIRFSALQAKGRAMGQKFIKNDANEERDSEGSSCESD